MTTLVKFSLKVKIAPLKSGLTLAKMGKQMGIGPHPYQRMESEELGKQFFHSPVMRFEVYKI